MVTLTPLQKEKKKKKLSQYLEVHISEMPGTIYLKFGMWGTDIGGHLHSKNCLVSYKHHIYAKIALLFFLPIYSLVWRTGFLGHTTHYRVF